MAKKKRIAIALGLIVVVALAAVVLIPQVEFVVGGALVNLGYRLQDRLGKYDLEHDESIAPGEIWEGLVAHNDLAADVRDVFPRTVRHPAVAILACMDARIDTSELVGDTRRYYYVVRTAGSVLAPAEQEMLELAVLNGVKVLLLTSHSDCAAEAAASNPESRAKFPALTELMDARVQRVQEFLARPVIRDAIEKGELEVKFARIDTDSDRLVVGDIVPTFPVPSVGKEPHGGH
ncbi:MAG: hypothetical protein AMJ63_08915 [Myxococcales bacterium SG8_38_1]|jgi:hypothetical protein|nr:MAG: hypothetical protein AMJ63_08915 [Myxococcales bacterium SG8_38_1]